jgi:hypothetical protein
MKSITKKAWHGIHLKACDIGNAIMNEDETMRTIFIQQMHEMLDDLERQFGTHPQIMATRADFLDDREERLRLYEAALKLARERGDSFEVVEILDSLEHLDD